ncbi:FeoB-associated Cys-rich membrane protein [Arcticibacter tournemirensis]|uniref:FeoB-associated Cys-rich membrane protein n=1 Tax=Arcticibacter tournemirensis TaxID=699437 RepID=A0A4Q0MFJ4_9SPHI|nr:FeoB-associated Cys-rich membrane protein [Arcticibacter tournemirensis]RXF71973.1 FeoB-associated Cys-rich membrane protein [Arcticibacter tournemirensis]
MRVQEIIVICLFLIALFYIGRMIYRNLNSKKGCGHCNQCGIDFSIVDPQKKKDLL